MTLSTTIAVSSARAATDRTLRVTMADDDRNDHLLVLMAAEAAGLNADFTFVDDGWKLMTHLAGITHPADLPDLVVLDLRMPGLNGHRTLEQLQAHPTFWQIPVVVFTSSTQPVDEIQSFNRGARWVETKPQAFGGLVEFVATFPERAAAAPYVWEDEAEAGMHLTALSADLVAEIEDELLRQFPD